MSRLYTIDPVERCRGLEEIEGICGVVRGKDVVSAAGGDRDAPQRLIAPYHSALDGKVTAAVTLGAGEVGRNRSLLSSHGLWPYNRRAPEPKSIIGETHHGACFVGL